MGKVIQFLMMVLKLLEGQDKLYEVEEEQLWMEVPILLIEDVQHKWINELDQQHHISLVLDS